MPYDRVAKYVQGNVRNPRGDVLGKLSEALHISEVWLMYGVEADPIHSQSYVNHVRLADMETLKQDQNVNTLWTGGVCVVPGSVPDQCFATTIEDDGDAPEFRRGDTVVFDPELSPSQGQVVLAIVNGNVLLRRYQVTRLDGKGRMHITLAAIGAGQPSVDLEPGDRFRIIGVATLHVRKLA